MGSKPFHDENYSNLIIHDERKRYYVLFPRLNRPLLDDEARNLQLSLLDQLRRSVQHTYGEIGAPLETYSEPLLADANKAFKIEEASSNANNFKIVGGNGLESPGVLFVKGLYVFYTSSIDYIDQNNTTDLTKDEFTETLIPDLSTPVSEDRIDIVYLDLHFGEVSAVENPVTKKSEYTDTDLRNHVVGTETANRLRAVFDIRVYEGWDVTSKPISSSIFNDPEFLGSIDGSDPEGNPLYKQHFKCPLAVIYRPAGQSSILQENITDLLDLYDKRIMSLQEVTHRSSHGGYTEKDLVDQGLTGFTARYPLASVDEGAYATGLNEGFGSEALNSEAVTPRTVDKNGKFAMGALMVGGETGVTTYPIDTVTGPVDLEPGEVMVNHASAKSAYIGYDRGITGLREYTDRLNIHMQGLTGADGLAIRNDTGETGTRNAYIASLTGPHVENFITVDYRGRLGLNTNHPGWEAVKDYWNVGRYLEAVNLMLDIDDSARIRKHLFVDRDAYFNSEVFGPTWQIPDFISSGKPALFGFTGIPQIGTTGTFGSLQAKPGMTAVGDTGIEGYTGNFGFYESFDTNGDRVFTIGSLGEDYNRVIKTLYGVGKKNLFYNESSLLNMPSGYGSLTGGDSIDYSGTDFDGDFISGTYTVTGAGGLTGVYDFADFLENEFEGSTKQIIVNESDSANHGKIILKDNNDFSSLDLKKLFVTKSYMLSPSPSPLEIPWIESGFYGSGSYGGEIKDIKFAKLDLGEAADAWLFNGDVFFNQGGLLNRVTFSPNAIFQNDVFIHGNFIAQNLVFSAAKVNSIDVSNRLNVTGKLGVEDGAVFGYDLPSGYLKLMTLQNDEDDLLKILVNGNIKANAINLAPFFHTEDDFDFGELNITDDSDHKLLIGGDVVTGPIADIITDTNVPLGVHLINEGSAINTTEALNADGALNRLVFDYSNGRGIYGDIELFIRGKAQVDHSIVTKHLSIGESLTDADTNYRLFVGGSTRIDGILEVQQLKFTTTDTPAEESDVINTPSNNVVLIDSNEEDDTSEQNATVLRNKKFTITKNTTLRNKNKLGGYYKDISEGKALFALDSMSFKNEIYKDVSGNDPDLISINDPSFQNPGDLDTFRRNFSRVIVARLGTLEIEWQGYTQGNINYPDSSSASDVVTRYTLKSAYAPDQEWLVGSARNNSYFIVKPEASIIASYIEYPHLFTTDKPLGVYIPLSRWKREAIEYPVGSGLYSNVLYYPYDETIRDFNDVIFTRQDTIHSSLQITWKIAVYPRIRQQARTNKDTNTKEYKYVGEWDLDVVIYPENEGDIANLIGKLYMSYFP